MAMSSKGKNKSSSKDISVETVVFTENGSCDDEVTLSFEDDKKLYASKNFLRYASSVFEAMFAHGWKEGKENSVDLKGKKSDDFLEFLLSIHPRVFKPITEENVLQIVPIAEEYQVTTIIKKCKQKMLNCLLSSLKQAKEKGSYFLHHVEHLRFCLRIAATTHELGYKVVLGSAIKTIARFGHVLYNKGQVVKCGYYSPYVKKVVGDERIEEIQKHCMDLFNELPVEVKYQILSERLLLMTDVDLKM